MELLKKIATRGFYEQERQYLFPALYGSKAVTKNTIEWYRQCDRNIMRKYLATR